MLTQNKNSYFTLKQELSKSLRTAYTLNQVSKIK